jgi:hypothetical protein
MVRIHLGPPLFLFPRGLSSVGRATALHAVGQRFEPASLHFLSHSFSDRLSGLPPPTRGAQSALFPGLAPKFRARPCHGRRLLFDNCILVNENTSKDKSTVLMFFPRSFQRRRGWSFIRQSKCGIFREARPLPSSRGRTASNNTMHDHEHL